MTAAPQTARKPKKGAFFTLAAVTLAGGLLVTHEGMVLKPYKDVVGVTTVCVGETDKKVVLKKAYTRAECMALMDKALQTRMLELANCVRVPVTPYEAAAVASWAYNVGNPAACKSNLVAKLNAGADSAVWCRDLLKWIYAGGKVWPGLVRRRQDEYAMCLGKKPSALPYTYTTLPPASDVTYQPTLHLTPNMGIHE